MTTSRLAAALTVATLAALTFVGCRPPAGRSAAPAAPRDASPSPTLFRDVAVLSMTGDGEALPERSVLIRGDRIAAVGPAGEVAAPPGVRVIEGAGRVLLPGLADLHVHLDRLPDPRLLALFVAYGVTTVRNMDGRPFVLEWQPRIEAEELLGPRIVTAGPILEGPEPFWDDTRVVAGAEEARRAVAEQVAVGYDFVKVYHTLGPEEYRAVLAEAGRLGVPVAGHAPNGVPLEEILAGGQRSIEHLDGYLDEIEAEDSPFRDRWSWLKLYLAVPVDPEKVADVARATAEAGTWNVPTLTVKARIDRPEVVEGWLDDPLLRLLPEELLAAWHPRNFPQLQHLDESDLEALRRGEEVRERLVAALHRAGAGVLAGTDTPNPFVVPGASLHEELERLVAAGLSPYDALAAATSEAGRFLGEEIGTVEVGAVANLVLLDGDPLRQVADTRRIDGVMLRGRWLPRERLDDVLAELVRD